MSDPFDRWFRRFGGSSRDDPFARILAEMQEQMRRLDTGSIRRMQQSPEHEPGVRTWSYGYRITTGPDGEPHVETWGQAPDDHRTSEPHQVPGATVSDRVGPAQGDWEHRTPHITSSLDPDNGIVTVTAELPGVDSKDIHVDAAGDRLHIHAETGPRRYNTEVHLDASVDGDALITAYRHGILEIRAPVKTG